MTSQEEIENWVASPRADKDPKVRARAVEALVKSRDARVIEPLVQALHDEHWDVRRRAAWALGNLGEPAVEPLIRALQDWHWDVRRKVAWALGNLRDRRAVEPLICAVQDERADVREQAAWALGHIQDLSAVEPLSAALLDDYAPVWHEAARALATLAALHEAQVESALQAYASNLTGSALELFARRRNLYEQELKKLQHQHGESSET
jgi:HEAT repeat protein